MSNDSKRTKTSGRVTGWLDRLSTSNLVFVVAAAFVVNVFVPDPLPFIDEIVLGILTLLLARLRSRAFRARDEASASSEKSAGGSSKPPPKNVTPKR